jgi:hypothetical protein
MTTTQTMGELIDQFEAELIARHKAITPEQFAAENQRRKVKAEYEAKHTPIETDEDRANTDEYPTEDETE